MYPKQNFQIGYPAKKLVPLDKLISVPLARDRINIFRSMSLDVL